MIDLQDPVKVVENTLALKRIANKFRNEGVIMLEDKLRFYEAKANLCLKKFEDSNNKDDRVLMKALSAIRKYDEIDYNNEFLGLV